jgi:putative transposase
MKKPSRAPHSDQNTPISYAGYRFPSEIISYAVWLYFRFPLSLRMVEEMLAARGIEVTYETVRSWALRFGQDTARRYCQLAEPGRQLIMIWVSPNDHAV